MKILLLKGLPASGKTTYAKELVKQGWKRVNKDDLRSMIDDGKWSKVNEKLILEIRDKIIGSFILKRHNIVIDDTNFEKKHFDRISELISAYDGQGYEIEEEFINTPVEECIRRDFLRPKPVGKDVILGMWRKYLKPTYPKTIPNVPDCIICDIDGTLAEKGDRDIYDGSKCYLDTVIEPVAEIVRNYLGTQTQVFFLSGRDVEHMGVTEKWLCDNGLVGGELIMRKNGDKRSDDIVKNELYNEHIKGKYNVRFVIDDRKRVKRMWVNEGLFVLDANQFDLEY